MLQKIVNFIKYNNAFTLGVMVVFLGTGMSFAASPNLRASVYSSSETISTVDNGLIVSSDLDNLDLNLTINAVTEDDEYYYVAYSYQTLAIQDGVWRNTNLNKTLKVSKALLAGKDLGLYVAGELSENINYELSYLKRVQELEKNKGQSNKTITTIYGGLVGKLIDPKEKVIEGYKPVIPELIPEKNKEEKRNPEEKVTPTPNGAPQRELDEATIRRIVEQMLAESQNGNGNESEEEDENSGGGGSGGSNTESETTPEEEPTEPEPAPEEETTPIEEETTPEVTPEPIPGEPAPEVTPGPEPEPEVTSESETTPGPTPKTSPEEII